MTTAADKAVRAQGGGLVTSRQIKAMIVTARRAYDVQAKMGLVDDGIGFDAWRRANLHDVVGAAASGSFRLVTQRDYAAVIGYFGELAGDERTTAGGGAPALPTVGRSCGTHDPTDNGRSCGTHDPTDNGRATVGRGLRSAPTLNDVREADERRRALWSLGMAEDIHADAFGGADGARRYADAIFANVHGTNRYTATARQVWAVIFTIRNRASAKRAKTALGARGASGVPLSPPTRSGVFPVRFPCA